MWCGCLCTGGGDKELQRRSGCQAVQCRLCRKEASVVCAWGTGWNHYVEHWAMGLHGRGGEAGGGGRGAMCERPRKPRLTSLDLILKILKSDWIHECKSVKFRLSHHSQAWRTLTLKQLGGQIGEAAIETSKRPNSSSSSGHVGGFCVASVLEAD